MYITMPFMSKLGATIPPKRVHVICGPEPPKAKGPRLLASTNRRLFERFNDVSSLKAVELKKLCTFHGIDETYPKKKCNPPDFKFYPSQLTDENFPHMV